MKRIPLTKGEYAIVDDEDYGYLNRFKWFLVYDCNGKPYIRHSMRSHTSSEDYKKIYVRMEDMIVPPKFYSVISHKNKDNLDCRKSNLFYESYSVKRHRADKTSGKTSSRYKGVSKYGKTKKWTSCIYKSVNGVRQRFHLGYFYIEKEAAIAYNEKAKELYGEFAYQNKIE